jgi:hypothetical protein
VIDAVSGGVSETDAVGFAVIDAGTEKLQAQTPHVRAL